MSLLSSEYSCFLCGDEISAATRTKNENADRKLLEKKQFQSAVIVTSLLFERDEVECDVDDFNEIFAKSSYCGRCEVALKDVRTQFRCLQELNNGMAATLGNIARSMSNHYNKLFDNNKAKENGRVERTFGNMCIFLPMPFFTECDQNSGDKAIEENLLRRAGRLMKNLEIGSEEEEFYEDEDADGSKNEDGQLGTGEANCIYEETNVESVEMNAAADVGSEEEAYEDVIEFELIGIGEVQNITHCVYEETNVEIVEVNGAADAADAEETMELNLKTEEKMNEEVTYDEEGAAFSRSDRGLVHLVEAKAKPNVCTVCSRAYNLPRCLARHMRCVHPEKELPDKLKKITQYQCPICPKFNYNKKHLDTHIRVYHANLPKPPPSLMQNHKQQQKSAATKRNKASIMKKKRSAINKQNVKNLSPMKTVKKGTVKKQGSATTNVGNLYKKSFPYTKDRTRNTRLNDARNEEDIQQEITTEDSSGSASGEGQSISLLCTERMDFMDESLNELLGLGP